MKTISFFTSFSNSIKDTDRLGGEYKNMNRIKPLKSKEEIQI